MAEKTKSMPNGAAAAAFVASGIGCLMIGLLTTLAEASAGIKAALNLYNPVGPLSGKTIGGVVVWLIAWIVLHYMWKDKEVDLRRMYIVTLVLLAIGFLLTFPPIFAAFAPGE